jgi:hypothetical protein
VGETSLSAKGVTVKVQAFRVDSPISDGSGLVAKIEPDRVQFKEGAFDSDRAYLYKTTDTAANVYKLPTQKMLKLDYQARPELIDGISNQYLGLSYHFDGVTSSFYLGSYTPYQAPIKLGVL